MGGFIALAFLALTMECCYAAYTDRIRDKHKVGLLALVGGFMGRWVFGFIALDYVNLLL